ncbi:MAG TPA: hypothetical protein VJ969_12385 [Desulfopila sp.]|nr:hypothetical protein [Desulfopila sp.]
MKFDILLSVKCIILAYALELWYSSPVVAQAADTKKFPEMIEGEKEVYYLC